MYTEDSGNATPPVSHCDHNKIKAAAVTKLSIPSEIRYRSIVDLTTFYTQFLMLNLKNLFSEAENKKKTEDLAHFEKVVIFEKIGILRVFRIFRPEGRIC
jgi:hypothetical protein